MPVQDVLIHLRRCEDGVAATEAGLKLAARIQAHVLGLHVVSISPVAFASPEAVAMHVNEANHLHEEAVAREPWWREKLAQHGLQGEWQVAQGETVESLCHAARWCDLIVVERPTLNPDAPTGWGIVSRTVFGSSAPVLVVPEAARVDHVGEHILVAWNASPEATLALHGAVPLLQQASKVTVLEGDPIVSPFGLRYLPTLDLPAWLQRRGIEAEFRSFKPEKEHGAELLDIAHSIDADLIVTGAWGHSRITELVLGGVTRYLFQNSDLPLLVAH